MKKLIFILLVLTVLTGCAAPITKDGSQVRKISPDGVNDCKFLGIVETDGGLFYSSLPEARRDMYNKLRNETARLGGNAYAVTTVEAERGLSLPFAQADAYDCPK